ncbi:MAG: hypothetical protein ACREMH_10145, partial [Gemmatimonadales bacterium]
MPLPPVRARCFLALLLTFGLLTHPAPAQQSPPHAFSDAHVHLNDPGVWIQLMNETGVDRAIVMAGRNTDNSALLAAVRHWPGRLLPFLTMSPEFREFRPAWEADDARFEPWLDSVLTAGGF